MNFLKKYMIFSIVVKKHYFNDLISSKLRKIYNNLDFFFFFFKIIILEIWKERLVVVNEPGFKTFTFCYCSSSFKYRVKAGGSSAAIPYTSRLLSKQDIEWPTRLHEPQIIMV